MATLENKQRMREIFDDSRGKQTVDNCVTLLERHLRRVAAH